LAPSAWAIALPIEMPRPDDHSPVFGSFENQGGACVTPGVCVPEGNTCANTNDCCPGLGLACLGGVCTVAG